MEVIELFPTSIAQFRYDKNNELKKIAADIMQHADEADITVKEFSTHYFENSLRFIEYQFL